MKISLLALTALGLAMAVFATGCAISTPFGGPGFDRERGVTAVAADERVIVALTHAVLGERRQAFDRQVGLVADTLPSQQGLIAYSLRKELLGNEAWTMTVWRDEESLQRFVRSSAHQQAIRSSAGELAAVRFSRFEVPASSLPLGWDEALEYLAGNSAAYSN
ncbi:MAG: antibiotic biosynthesis monooxygenase [Gammaproteobacteria bacterium]|nr:antibiotic biosynthesis monooxygenase [Gammaproteobacteria bacterium]